MHNILLAIDVCQIDAGLESCSEFWVKRANFWIWYCQNRRMALWHQENEFTAFWASVASFVKMRRVSSRISKVPSRSKILRNTLTLPFPDSTYLGFLVLVSGPISHLFCENLSVYKATLLEVECTWWVLWSVAPSPCRTNTFIPLSGCPRCLWLAHSWVLPRESLSVEEGCVAQGPAPFSPSNSHPMTGQCKSRQAAVWSRPGTLHPVGVMARGHIKMVS